MENENVNIIMDDNFLSASGKKRRAEKAAKVVAKKDQAPSKITAFLKKAGADAAAQNAAALNQGGVSKEITAPKGDLVLAKQTVREQQKVENKQDFNSAFKKWNRTMQIAGAVGTISGLVFAYKRESKWYGYIGWALLFNFAAGVVTYAVIGERPSSEVKK